MQDLLASTIRAFETASLSPHEEICLAPTDDEGVGIFFRGKPWHSISASDLRANPFAATVMTPAAFAYFAPAYIVSYLQDRTTLDSAVESFVCNLGAGGHNGASQHSRASEIARCFTPSQLRVVRDFLRFYVATEGPCSTVVAHDALEVYGAA